MGWLTGWNYRRQHTIIGSSGAGAGYTICFKVYPGSGTCATEAIRATQGGKVYCNNHCKNDFGDLRFTASDGITVLPYWFEEKVDGSHVIVWVKIPDDLGQDRLIYIYYGKTDASYVGDGDQTFLFFDNFNGPIDWVNKWQSVDQSFYSIENGRLKCLYPASAGKLIQTKNKFNNGFAAESRIRCSVTNTQMYLVAEPNAGAYTGKESSVLVWNIDMTHCSINGLYNRNAETEDLVNFYNAIYFCPATGNAKTMMYKDGVWRNQYVDVPSSRNVYICHLAWAVGGIGYADWTWVRKYVNPEPAHGEWGAETNVLGGIQPADAEPLGVLTEYHGRSGHLEDVGKEGSLVDVGKEGIMEEVPR